MGGPAAVIVLVAVAAFVFLGSASAIAIAGGASMPSDLVGKWRASGETPPDPQGRRMSWYAEYDFRSDGTFLMTGYPPISVNGKCAVVGREKGRVHLRLTERKMSGSPWPDIDEWAPLSDDGKTLKFDNKTFTRQ